MDLFSGAHQRTLVVLLVCSSLSVASGKESHPVLKCNSYADAEDRGWEKLSRGRESPFLLQVTRTEVEDEMRFQYRGRFNILGIPVPAWQRCSLYKPYLDKWF